MNKFVKIVSFFTIFIGLVALTCFTSYNVNANEINESYDYSYDLEISNNSYYFSVSRDINYYYAFNHFEDYSFDVDILYNNINYTKCFIIFRDGGILIQLSDIINNSNLTIFSCYLLDTPDYYNFDRFNLFNDNVYTIALEPTINYFFNFENFINNGYYTFNQSINGLTFTDYTFYSFWTGFDINGTLVYLNEDGYYLFNKILLDPRQSYFSLSMFSVNVQSSSYEISGSFTNDNDFLRYLYLDNQYIDTFLYEYLNNNGIFAFSYAGLTPNASFWDVINAYINIPNTVIAGMLDFSIFNGTTLLLIFATLIIIVFAVKIIKMINWR